jgi:hypothetical protein
MKIQCFAEKCIVAIAACQFATMLLLVARGGKGVRVGGNVASGSNWIF